MKAIFAADPHRNNNAMMHVIARKIELDTGINLAIVLCEDNGWQALEFDVLFFDYGLPASLGFGWDVFDLALKHAEDHPSRFYVLASMFTQQAVKDIRDGGRDVPANVLFEIEDIYPYLSEKGER